MLDSTQPRSFAFKLWLVFRTEGNSYSVSAKLCVSLETRLFLYHNLCLVRKLNLRDEMTLLEPPKRKGKSQSQVSLTPRSLVFTRLYFAPGTHTEPTSGLSFAQVLTWPQPLYTGSWCVVHFRYPEDIGILRTLSSLPDRAFYCITVFYLSPGARSTAKFPH